VSANGSRCSAARAASYLFGTLTFALIRAGTKNHNGQRQIIPCPTGHSAVNCAFPVHSSNFGCFGC
jgi:hypothetical protein